jgi:hypothetical protein
MKKKPNPIAVEWREPMEQRASHVAINHAGVSRVTEDPNALASRGGLVGVGGAASPLAWYAANGSVFFRLVHP